MKFPREFYFPKDARVIRYRDPEAMIAVYEISGRPYACMFGGKRSKPDKHYRYTSEESRRKAVDEYIRGLKASQEMKAKWRASRQGAHPLKVGDILYASWGYDQTNIDFYEVVGVPSKCFVEIQPIQSAPAFGADMGGPQERVMPAKGQPVERSKDDNGVIRKKPARVMRKKADKNGNVTIDSVRHASPWKGNALSQTGFGWGH